MAMTRPTTASRRDRSLRLIYSAIGLLATAMIVVVVNVLAARVSIRLDVTSTGSLRPAARTVAVVGALPEQAEVVLAANLTSSGRDRQAISRVLDMLDEMDHLSPSLRTTIIDTGTAEGLSQYEHLVARLASERSSETESAIRATDDALDALQSFGEHFEPWASAVQQLADDVATEPGGVNPWKSELLQRASQMRVSAGQVPQVVDLAHQSLDQLIGSTPVPDVRSARRQITTAFDILAQLLSAEIEDLHTKRDDQRLSPEGQARIDRLIQAMQGALDSSSARMERFRNQPLPVLSRVATALGTGEAAIVIGSGPEALSAIGIDDLIPPTAPGAARIDAGRRAESLITDALASVEGSATPVTIVLMHASTNRVLGDGGIMSELVRSSSLRNTTWVEWPISIEPEQPSAVTLAKSRGPVVYVVIGLSMTSSGAAERAAQMGAAVRSLLDQGAPVLLNLSPSTLPAIGEPDPIAETLAGFGLRADTGRPTLVEHIAGDRREVDWEQLIIPEGGQNPVAEVIKGLPVRLTWPIVIEREKDIGQAWPLIGSSESGMWSEAEWVGYWLTRESLRRQITDPPKPGGPGDGQVDNPVFAWAAERAGDGLPQRLIVVGSHLWMFDTIAHRRTTVDGRVVETSPGNTELFNASIDWLAGREDQIARGAEAESFPIVQPMSQRRLMAARWFFIGGLPLLVLVAGAIVRLLTG